MSEIENGDLYELHWNNHSCVLKGTFDIFRNDNELIDVTLCFAGGQKLRAHKIVLSACSEYFFEIFKDNPCHHPIIILTEIGYEMMKNILDFMYTGEINIQIENLDRFLKIAEFLQIKGLTIQKDPNKNETITTNPKKRNFSKTTNENFISTKKKLRKDDTLVLLEDKIGVKKTSSEELDDQDEDQKPGIIDLDLLDDNPVEYNDFEALPINSTEDVSQLNNKNNTGKSLSSFPCPYCKKIFNHYISLKLHLPSHSGDTSCHLCGAVLGRKYDLKVHMKRKHNVNLNSTPSLTNQQIQLEHVNLNQSLGMNDKS